jgi:hypothetical protein
MNMPRQSIFAALLNNAGLQAGCNCEEYQGTPQRLRPDIAEVKTEVLRLTHTLESLLPMLSSMKPEMKEQISASLSLAKKALERQ